MDEIISEYQSGVSLKTLAKKYGAHVNTIRNRLKKEYPSIYQPDDKGQRRWFGEEKDRLIEMYLSGSSMRQICAEFNVERQRVSRLLKKFGVRKTSAISKEGREKLTKQENKRWFGKEKDRLIEMYLSGATIEEISASFNIGKTRIYELLDQFGVAPNYPKSKD